MLRSRMDCHWATLRRHSATSHHSYTLSAEPKIVLFFDTECAIGNGQCVVGIYLMCSSIFSNEVVQNDRF